MKVLMIGNSFCYYFVKELHGMAKAVGMDIEVCNVYYSGCTLEQHWTWFEEGAANYRFYITNDSGRNRETACDLLHCLAARDWDVISLQQGSGTYKNSIEDAIEKTEPYVANLYQYLRERFPNARYLWHQTWSSQQGYQCPADETNKVPDRETQKHRDANAIGLAKYICETYKVERIPTGDAWDIAREDKRIGDTLCNRADDEGNDTTDNHHDGNVGGGRYLNACVWFEVLTGKSCVGNTYVPEYELCREKMQLLQEIAHKAVAKIYGEIK